MIPSPVQWTVLLRSDLHWKQRYPEIAARVREFLAAIHHDHPGAELSTTGLVEVLMPLAMCRGEAITARNQLFKVLMTLSKNELSDCARRGDEKKGKFGVIRPIYWHAPIAKTCPHCNGVL